MVFRQRWNFNRKLLVFICSHCTSIYLNFIFPRCAGAGNIFQKYAVPVIGIVFLHHTNGNLFRQIAFIHHGCNVLHRGSVGKVELHFHRVFGQVGDGHRRIGIDSCGEILLVDPHRKLKGFELAVHLKDFTEVEFHLVGFSRFQRSGIRRKAEGIVVDPHGFAF